ncbi:dipeptidase [Yeosuana sp. MJ-SS3]|uniref:Dipeptidase n=1 Tax=Gilvirhabdus luticola TaxID=3079858 RepID=A0ABU3U9G3_9FLAO|nr:dipeptidase [Yeosuana sp. MJ-SS3]MDU8887043.1 dipeptidase [Yeosuana sp. MJ-SS3]
MKRFYSIFFSIMLIISCKETTEKMTDSQLIEKAKSIHKNVIVLDTHCDIDVINFTDSVNYSQNLQTQVNLPKMKKGGLDVAWFIVFTAQDSLTDEGFAKAYDNALSKFEAIHKLTEQYAPDQIELATTSDDVKRIHASGKLVAMIGIENGYPVGLDINRVKEFYELGGRYMSLAHQGHNQLSDSNNGEENNVWLHNGLSDFGKEVIKEMNKYGIMIDVSHPSKEAMRQMLEITKAPIIASHSSARALNDVSRNLDDEQLGWMKQNGGVVQAVALDQFLDKKKNDTRNAKMMTVRMQVADSLGLPWYETWENMQENLIENELIDYVAKKREIIAIADKKVEELDGFPPAVSVSDLVDHIDYMVEKIGIDHVGISSDFDGGGGIKGWNDASETFNVTLELVKRGYSEEDINKLWSGNLLRVLDEVQAIANTLK